MNTLNLLPASRRSHMRREALLMASTRLARTIVGGLFLVSLGGVLVLVGFWLASLTPLSSSDVERSLVVADYVAIKGEIDEQNELLGQVRELDDNRMVWSDVLLSLMQEFPPDTSLLAVTADAGDKTLEIDGSTLTRGELVVFENRLKDLTWIQELSAPASNLLSASNPVFSFSLVVNPGAVLQAGEEEQ